MGVKSHSPDSKLRPRDTLAHPMWGVFQVVEGEKYRSRKTPLQLEQRSAVRDDQQNPKLRRMRSSATSGRSPSIQPL